ncbi:MiaB/RimO family radical SAM methylthiotransferase [Candidatus Margulisiibacteriota bacterium]
MTRYAFYTLGCKANQYQTEALKSQVAGHGSQVVDFSSEADVYVINTCTVTYDAERTSRQAIRRALRQNPKARVIVTGCYAKLNRVELKRLFPQVEIRDPSHLSTQPPIHPATHVRRNLMIQDGCEHFCSYCIVPYARGKIKSKPVEDVVSEAGQMVQAGAREIILTGINLGTYQYDLAKVIARLSEMEDLARIRLSSLEPMYIKKELIEAAAKIPKVCRHLHIPLQSGDDNILEAMNRTYSRADYRELISYIRNKMPDCGITTDVIVGFPGEGEKEFQNTVALIKEIRFSRLHIFSYSPRKSTPAAGFRDQVDPAIKKKRNQALHHLRDKHTKEFARQYLGKEVEILVEQKGSGLTSNYIRVLCSDTQSDVGKVRRVRIRGIKEGCCLAE